MFLSRATQRPIVGRWINDEEVRINKEAAMTLLEEFHWQFPGGTGENHKISQNNWRPSKVFEPNTARIRGHSVTVHIDREPPAEALVQFTSKTEQQRRNVICGQFSQWTRLIIFK
jgi:hypothetical protein